MNIIDVIIVLALLMGATVGYKSGIIRSTVSFLGAILAIVLAYYLKGFLSQFLLMYLPFFKFKGAFQGLTVLNIFIYEALAFLIIFTLLMIIVHVLVYLAKGMEKVLDFTILLSIPSKILGGIFGMFETYIFVFILLFAFIQFSFSTIVLYNSKLADPIINRTPILSPMVKDTYTAFKNIYDLNKMYGHGINPDKYNEVSLDIMLKYKVCDIKTVKKLRDNGKLYFKGLDDVIKRYEGEQG